MTIQEQKAADKNLARLPLDGARYLRDVQAADPMLCALIAHHTGAVGEAEERGLATDLAEFGVPAQLGWRLSVLTAADMTTGPDGVAVSPTRIGQILLRYSQGTTSSIGQ